MNFKAKALAVVALLQLTGCVTMNDLCGEPTDEWSAKDLAEWIDCRDRVNASSESISEILGELSEPEFEL